MAGRYQHYIPQSFLRGFRAPGGSKKQSRIWIYENDSAPRLELIKRKVGGEPFFYSELSTTGDKTLDDHITDYENRFAALLEALKSAPLGSTVDAEKAAEVIAHLTVRNAHLRRILTFGTVRLFEEASSFFGNKEKLRPALGVDDRQPSQRLKEAIDEHLDQHPEAGNAVMPRRVLYHVAQVVFKEQFNRIFQERMSGMAASLGLIASHAPTLVRAKHNQILVEDTQSDRWIELLQELSWSVHGTSESMFVLPDCVALARSNGAGYESLLTAGLKNVRTVVMPLTSSRMLVGLGAGVPMPDLADSNREAAASSLHFFLASQEMDELKILQPSIGISSVSWIEKVVDGAFDQFAGVGGAGSRLAEGDEPETAPGSALPSFPSSFLGCADEETAKRIATEVYALAREFCRAMPLDRLDGITFAADYPAALRELDRGYPASDGLEPRNDDYGVGVAMAPLVVRDSVPKVRIVMRGEVGHALIDESGDMWRRSRHMLVALFGRASYIQLLDVALPGVLLSTPRDRFASSLYGYAATGWESYFTARASATTWPEVGEEYSKSLKAALHRAQTDILAERYEYRFHGDLDRLLNVVLPRVEEILNFAGLVLGHNDGLSSDPSRTMGIL